MIKDIRLWLVCAVAILLGGQYCSRSKLDETKAELNLMKSNFIEIQKSSSYVTISVTELKSYLTEIDLRTESLMREQRIRPKDVTGITNVYHQYFNSDTTSAKIVDTELYDSMYIHNFEDNNGCFKVKGEVITMQAEMPIINITERMYANEDTYIAHLVKGKRFRPWQFWTKRPVHVELYINSKCGESKVKQLKIDPG